MADPLASSLLKVQRAAEQIAHLASGMKAFLDSNPYRIVRDVDHVAGRIAWRTTVREPCPPIWSVLIGECLHNLRSALDYMIWDLVILETGKHPVVTKSQFPIFLHEAGYNERAKGFLKGVGNKPRAVIKALQPFSTGENERSPLWQLHELSNWDKHRSLRLTGAHLHPWQNYIEVGITKLPGAFTGMQAVAPGTFEDNTVIMSLTFTGLWDESSTDVEVEGDFAFDISLNKIGPAQGAVVIPTLLIIHQRVFEIGKQLSVLWPS